MCTYIFIYILFYYCDALGYAVFYALLSDLLRSLGHFNLAMSRIQRPFCFCNSARDLLSETRSQRLLNSANNSFIRSYNNYYSEILFIIDNATLFSYQHRYKFHLTQYTTHMSYTHITIIPCPQV